jgi:hypothetical protein
MEAKLIAMPPHSVPPDYRGAETVSALDVGFLIVVTVPIIWAIVASIYTLIPKRVQQHLFSLKPPRKSLCHQCQYFGHNAYLKCTVHPSTVLTEQALDCSDYSPNSKARRVEED